MVIPLFGISKVVISDLWISFLSSDATCAVIASFVLLYPSASATSLPTNHTTPSISTVLSSPNCGWLNTVGASVGVDAWEMSRPGDVPSLCAFFQRCLFVTHPHSSRRKNAYSILPPGERDRINFVKYCWLYSSISLRNQSLFPEEHFPSHARKINPLAVYSIRPTILPVTSPLYSRIFLLCYCNHSFL